MLLATAFASMAGLQAQPTQELGMMVGATFNIVTPHFRPYETPVQLRATHYFDITAYNALARFHPVALDAWSKQAPEDRQPPELHNESNRLRCVVSAFYHTSLWLMPEASADLLEAAAGIGIDVADSSEPPVEVGRAAALASQTVAADDGWNAEGHFEDTIGYFPSNAPWGPVQHPRRWTPLKEQDGRGFVYWQQHVTPHIGFTSRASVLNAEERASMRTHTPDYDLEAEARLAVERVGLTAANDTRKMLIEFFDSKLDVVAALLLQMAGMFGWSIWDMYCWLIGFEHSGLDAVHLVWRDKVQNDHIRPTTVVNQRLATETFQTWAGPGKGLQAVQGKDWFPYIRVMPHAEHPSGSSCICSHLARYTELYANSTRVPLPVSFAPGSSKVEPGLTPATDLALTLETTLEWEQVCAESRLWGGMHFTGAIESGTELCRSLGDRGFELMQFLTSGGAAGDAFSGADAGDRSYQYSRTIQLVAETSIKPDCEGDASQAAMRGFIFPLLLGVICMRGGDLQ